MKVVSFDIGVAAQSAHVQTQLLKIPPAGVEKSIKYSNGIGPQWVFREEKHSQKVAALQEKYKKEFLERVTRRKRRERDILKEEHNQALCRVGPEWYQELSPRQKSEVDEMKTCLRKDIYYDSTIATKSFLSRLGLRPLPNPKQIRKALKGSEGSPVEFLLELYQLMKPNRRNYSINDRLLLSAVVHLTLENTLREMHIRLPSPPRKKRIPKQIKQKFPRRICGCGTKYTAYLVPFTYVRPKPKCRGYYKHPHIQHPQSEYFNYICSLRNHLHRRIFCKTFRGRFDYLDQIPCELHEIHTAAEEKYNELFPCTEGWYSLLKLHSYKPCPPYRIPIKIPYYKQGKIGKSKSPLVQIEIGVKIYRDKNAVDKQQKKLECSIECKAAPPPSSQKNSAQYNQVTVARFMFTQNLQDFQGQVWSQDNDLQACSGEKYDSELEILENCTDQIFLGTPTTVTSADCTPPQRVSDCRFQLREQEPRKDKKTGKTSSVRTDLDVRINQEYIPLDNKRKKSMRCPMETISKKDMKHNYSNQSTLAKYRFSKFVDASFDSECTHAQSLLGEEPVTFKLSYEYFLLQMENLLKELNCPCSKCKPRQRVKKSHKDITSTILKANGGTKSMLDPTGLISDRYTSKDVVSLYDRCNEYKEPRSRRGVHIGRPLIETTHKYSECNMYSSGGSDISQEIECDKSYRKFIEEHNRCLSTYGMFLDEKKEYIEEYMKDMRTLYKDPPVTGSMLIQEELRKMTGTVKPSPGKTMYLVNGDQATRLGKAFLLNTALLNEYEKQRCSISVESCINFGQSQNKTVSRTEICNLALIENHQRYENIEHCQNTISPSRCSTCAFEREKLTATYNFGFCCNQDIAVATIKNSLAECRTEHEQMEDEPCSCSADEPLPIISNEDEQIERYVIQKKLPNNRVKQMNVIKKLLKGLAYDGYPLAQLPKVHMLPYFELWMLFRTGKTWDYEDKQRNLMKCRYLWLHINKCKRPVLLPNIRLPLEKLNWRYAPTVKRVTKQAASKYYTGIRRNEVNFGREFFPTLYPYRYPTPEYLTRFYYAYFPGKEENSIVQNIWKPYEKRDSWLRPSCYCK